MKRAIWAALLVGLSFGYPSGAQAADQDGSANDFLFSDSISAPRIYLGFGADNISSSDGFGPSAYGMFEYASGIIDEAWGLRYRAGVEVSGVGVWGGAGFSVEHVFANTPYYVEIGSMVGFYTDVGDLDLGYPVEFRSQIIVGRHFDNGYDVGIGLTHKSNAEIGDTNPGSETIYIRVGKSF